MLTLQPDPGFLADPSVAFPVTVNALATDWWEAAHVTDTFVNNADYTESWNNFNLDRILVGKSNSGSVTWRSFIRFENIPSDSPLRGGRVQNADLTLWNHLSSGCGDSVGSGVTVRRITSEWDELTLRWAAQPSVTSTGAITEYPGYSPDCTGGASSWAGKEWDLAYSVNAIVQAWASGESNYGFQLTSGNESDSKNWRRFRTREYWGCAPPPAQSCLGTPHEPLLTVDYEPSKTEEIEIAYERDGFPDDQLPTYEELLANQIPQNATLPVEDPISLEEAADIQENSPQTEEIGPDMLPVEDLPPDEPPGEPDTTGPSVIATVPTDAATMVRTSTAIAAFFTEKISGPQIVMRDADGTSVSGEVSVSPSGERVDFILSAPLEADTTYVVELSGAQDVAGLPMEPTSWSFTTAPPDTTPPTVTEVTPADAAIGVAPATEVTATFSESVSDAQIAVTGSGQTQVVGTVAMDEAGTVLTFAPGQPLLPDTMYSVVVSGAKDAAGNVMAEPRTWSFRTLANDGDLSAVAHWRFDENTGTVARDVSGHGADATVAPGASWTSGQLGSALTRSGNGSLATVSRPLLRTDESYTVSGWVKLSDTNAWHQVGGQQGTNRSPFYLGIDPDTDDLIFVVYTADSTVWNGIGAYSGVDAPVGQWIHLAGVYNKAAGSIALYLNGNLIKTTTGVPPLWHAPSNTTLGPLSGGLDDVRMYQRALSATQIRSVYSLRGHWTFDEAAGTSLADASGLRNTGTLNADGVTRTTGKFGGGARRIGGGTIGSTAGPVVRTDQSFTMTAWVKLEEPAGHWSFGKQNGVNRAAFALGMSQTSRDLIFTVYSADSVEWSGIQAYNGTDAPTGQWFHAAGVYDRAAGSISLYLNGTLLRRVTGVPALWNANGAMIIGDSMNGTLDEVRLYQAALPAADIAALATATTSAKTAPAQSSGERSALSEGAAVAAARTGPWPTWPTKRIELSKCWDNNMANSRGSYPHGWIRDSYNWCSVRTVGKSRARKVEYWCGCLFNGEWGWTTKVEVTAKLEFLFSVAGHTFAGGQRGGASAGLDPNNGNINSRTIKMWARVDQIKTKGPMASVYFSDATDLTVNIGAGAPAGMNCSSSNGGARKSTLGEWRTNPQQYFEWVSHASQSMGPQKLSICTFTPTLALGIQAGAANPYISTKMLDTPIRCDTSDTITVYYGGCVFAEFTPTHKPHLIWDIDGDGDTEMNESADLIRRALEEPDETFPRKDGKKIIPGERGVGPLHRSFSTSREQSNRAKSVQYCAGILEHFGGIPSPKGRDCDEYPFASTHEGSKDSGANMNVAVDFILAGHNRSVGSNLKTFWYAYRVLGQDPWGNDEPHAFTRFYLKAP
uniref:LamG-like jellyroll fold domain-containing protein n=1 Tax=Herbidospora sakaeratensis TaxID=564415 RepID=UPI001471C72D|nr:LamG-like jellyroll fold domain-containing protein [Herbidospora sakaeratensis]